MDMNFRDLKYFLEVAETEKIGLAAERLNVTQPSLSVALKRLEDRFGTELFLRSKSGVRLTGSGKKLRDRALLILDLVNETDGIMEEEHSGVRGMLNFGCHPSVGFYTLSAYLPQLNKLYPELDLDFTHGSSREICELIIDGKLEMGLVINPLPHPDLVIRKLLKDEVSFWARKNISWKSKELKDWPWAYDPDLLQIQSLLKRAKESGAKASKVILSSSLENLVKIAECSDSIVIAPERVVKAHTRKKLFPVSGAPVFHDELALAYRQELKGLQKVKATREVIESSLKN